MKRLTTILLLLLITIPANAQKTVAGLKFSTCMNKELPAGFYKGKFLVLDFWATWCGPCIASFPKLSELEQKYKDNSSLVFASITGESKGKIDTFIKKKKDKLPDVLYLIDSNGATWNYYNVRYIPLVLVFAPSGEVVFAGKVEELVKDMDKLLNGENLVKDLAPIKKEVSDEWKKWTEHANYVAIAGPADTAEDERSNTFVSGEKVIFSFRRSKLSDVISNVFDLTAVRLKCSDSVRCDQLVNLYYAQERNMFPEFDKGLFGAQYQNHILHLLEQTFGFSAEHIAEPAVAWKIVEKDDDLLTKAATISTKGAYASLIDAKKQEYSFTNRPVSYIGTYAEDIFGTPFFTDFPDYNPGVDMVVEFSSLEGMKKSLATYGLGLEKTPASKYMAKKLQLNFR